VNDELKTNAYRLGVQLARVLDASGYDARTTFYASVLNIVAQIAGAPVNGGIPLGTARDLAFELIDAHVAGLPDDDGEALVRSTAANAAEIEEMAQTAEQDVAAAFRRQKN
jgi:hypothetical protein